MNRGIYSAATGMSAAEAWMDVIAHNLANASTAGFKREGIAFGEALDRAAAVGRGPQPLVRFTNFEPGPVQETGNALDLAILDRQGAFAVSTAAGVRYTRAGQFGVDAAGRLVDQAGNAVLDARGTPIDVPTGTATVTAEGDVSVGGEVVGRIGVFTGRFAKSGDGLWTALDARPATDARIRSGALEGSNVNVIESMIEMIQLSRAFEMAQRSAQTQDEMTGKLLGALQGR